MDPISNADRLVLLLRQKLEERARAATTARPSGRCPASGPPQASSVRALATIDWKDERPLRRAIIQNLLADQLGPELVNDAQFQQIVSRVSDAIEDNDDAVELLNCVVSDLRQP